MHKNNKQIARMKIERKIDKILRELQKDKTKYNKQYLVNRLYYWDNTLIKVL